MNTILLYFCIILAMVLIYTLIVAAIAHGFGYKKGYRCGSRDARRNLRKQRKAMYEEQNKSLPLDEDKVRVVAVRPSYLDEEM